MSLFPHEGLRPVGPSYGEKKIVRSNLATSKLPEPSTGLDLVEQMANGPVELYDLPDSPYHLEENEISVDLFCGAGGTSEGIRQALLESPAFAVNHNPDAIGVHDINHPETVHLESDVFAADPEIYISPSKQIGLLSASPSCVHFSTARGGKPLDREIRDQAWVVCNWCEHPNPRFNPRVVIVENVREFLTWAPLTSENKIDKRYIDKDGLGSTFKEWRSRLIDAGYTVEYKVLNAAAYGVPTKRHRLMIVARRDGLPIRFPKATHGPRNSPAVLAGELLPYAPVSDCIDFTIQCNPIFMYARDAKKARCNRPLADNTLKRIAAGIERYVLEAEKPHIVSFGGDVAPAAAGTALSDSASNLSLVNPLITPLTHTGPGRYYLMDSQLPTLTCARRGELALVSPVCAAVPTALAQPSENTITVQAASNDTADVPVAPIGFQITAPILDIDIAGEQGVTAPASPGAHFKVPTIVRVAHGSVCKKGKKRGRGDHDICEPLPTQSTSNEFAIIEPFMVTTGYGERRGQAPRVHSVDDPITTLVAGGAKLALVQASMKSAHATEANDNSKPDPAITGPSVIRPIVAAHMAQHNSGNIGHSVDDPMSTMTTKVCHQNLVTSHLLTLRQNTFGQSMDEPIPTLTAAGSHHGEVRASFVQYFSDAAEHLGDVHAVPEADLGLTEEQRFEAWWIARFLEQYGTKEPRSPRLAHLDGPRPSAIGRPGAILWTIQMRMLAPKEAYAASSFPKDYQFEKTADGRKTTKSTQLQLVGNAVPPGLAASIVGANLKPRRSLLPKPAAALPVAA